VSKTKREMESVSLGVRYGDVMCLQPVGQDEAGLVGKQDETGMEGDVVTCRGDAGGLCKGR
jgi:hypothetical protein